MNTGAGVSVSHAAASRKKTITAFEELSRDVLYQELPAGAQESDIEFPGELSVTVAVTGNAPVRTATASDAPYSYGRSGKKATLSDADREDEDGYLPDGDVFGVPAAELDEDDVIFTEEERLEDVEWELSEVSSAAFFSSENAGDSFVYVPVIPDGYALSEDMEKGSRTRCKPPGAAALCFSFRSPSGGGRSYQDQ